MDERKRELSQARGRRWRLAHRDEILVKRRAHYAATIDKQREYGRRLYQLHREVLRARSRTWRSANPDILKVSFAKYSADPRTKQMRVHYMARYRARKIGALGTHTLTEWLDKIALLGGCCIYCGRDDLTLTEDHKVPLSRGGSDDITNIVPACRPCNSRKHTRTAHEYLEVRAA